jgi:broad specificity phosphatase PhoE
VLLICHGSTPATRRTAFPLDEPLEPSALEAAAALRDRIPAGRPALTSPALRCRQTAEALELTATVDAGLADWDLGRWAGRSLDELATEAPNDVHSWTTDPTTAPHGGETLTSLITRIGRWLDDAPEDAADEPSTEAPDGAAGGRPNRFLAVTHPAVVRAAVVHALQTAPHSFWRIDVAPLAVVELRGRPGSWSLYPARL